MAMKGGYLEGLLQEIDVSSMQFLGVPAPATDTINEHLRRVIIEDHRDYPYTSKKRWVKSVQIGNGTGEEAKVSLLGKILATMASGRHGSRSIIVWDTTKVLLNANSVEPKDYLGEIRAVQTWIQNNVRYTHDNKEVFITPTRMLIDWGRGAGGGDCDDLAMLAAAMLRSIGYRTAVIIVDGNGGGIWSHAMAAVKTPRSMAPFGKAWIPIELTKVVPLGWKPPKMSQHRLFELKESGVPDKMKQLL